MIIIIIIIIIIIVIIIIVIIINTARGDSAVLASTQQGLTCIVAQNRCRAGRSMSSVGLSSSTTRGSPKKAAETNIRLTSVGVSFRPGTVRRSTRSN
jgi:hypothetical protein